MFTPKECGRIGCDFDDGLAVHGAMNVGLRSRDGSSTAGLDLVSRDPDLLEVTASIELDGAPSWQLTGLDNGRAELVAIDADGDEVDLMGLEIVDYGALILEPFVGDIEEVDEEGYDQAFTVPADAPVSWFVRPKRDPSPMGRIQIETVFDGPDLSEYEEASSDRPNGYFYVTLPAGDYPLEFQLSADPNEVFVKAMIHAE